MLEMMRGSLSMKEREQEREREQESLSHTHTNEGYLVRLHFSEDGYRAVDAIRDHLKQSVWELG